MVQIEILLINVFEKLLVMRGLSATMSIKDLLGEEMMVEGDEFLWFQIERLIVKENMRGKEKKVHIQSE